MVNGFCAPVAVLFLYDTLFIRKMLNTLRFFELELLSHTYRKENYNALNHQSLLNSYVPKLFLGNE